MRYLPALIVDVVLVLIFAVIGRSAHSEDPAGFLITAWPFLVALLAGHIVAALLPARPRRPWAPAWGAVVWIVTVAGGMLLRVAFGDTAELPFIIVATVTLGILLIGWRAVAALVRRRRTPAAASDLPEEPHGPATTAIPMIRGESQGLHDEAAAHAADPEATISSLETTADDVPPGTRVSDVPDEYESSLEADPLAESESPEAKPER